MASDVEIWESTIDSSCWVLVRDRTAENKWKHQRVAGKGKPGHRIQLTRAEREFNSEMVPEENANLDPFKNGHLVCTSGRPADERGRYELTDEDLMSILRVSDDEVFAEAIADIGIELPLRRLLALAEQHSTISRYAKIRDLIDGRYRPGGTQRAVAEMMAAGELLPTVS